MILGITGLTGTGKETASEFFKNKGWIILDADKIAHYLYRPYTAVWKAVVKAFGDGILNQDDVINRKKLGAVVFNCNDPEGASACLLKLNDIMHPAIRRYIDDEIHRHFRRGTNIVVTSALWKEIGLFDLADKVILLRSTPELIKKRIMARDQIDAPTLDRRLSYQSEPPHYDFSVENNGTETELYQKLTEILKQLKM